MLSRRLLKIEKLSHRVKELNEREKRRLRINIASPYDEDVMMGCSRPHL